LSAEVAWTGDGSARTWRSEPDWNALKACGRPIGLVLRVGAWSGPFGADAPQIKTLVALAAERLAQARKNGIQLSELQIDFDCAESKLAGYQTWLTALRASVRPIPLVFTALPVWLRHAEFTGLARAADGFILQVHSLERPTSPVASFTLCDPMRAREWAKQASAVGVPFRIALPTYGYDVAFSSQGKFLGLEAEASREWPAGTRLLVVEANPSEMCRLAAEWATYRVPNYNGVLWFRLPVPNDGHNWPLPTLLAVLAGKTPQARLETEVSWSEPGLAEVSLVNRGETRVRTLPEIALTWSGTPLASDALGGYRLEDKTLRPSSTIEGGGLAPGQRRPIAWLRFSHETPFTASLLPAQPSR